MSDTTITIIEARPATLSGSLKAVWQYRRFYPVLLREISMRKFRNTLLGFWWLIIRPLVPTAIAVITFTFFVKIDTGALPYGIFFLSGFIAWNLLHSCVQFMARTMLWTRNLLKKMYLPKLLVPMASIGPALIELLITVALFAILVAVYYVRDGTLYVEPSWRLLMVLPCLVLALVLAVSIGMVVSMIALFMRDIIYSIVYFIQIWMFLTPVIYPLSVVPEGVRWIFYVNPMTVVVETMRWALTGFGAFTPIWFAVGCLQVLLVAYLCLTFFTRAETYLADTV